MYHYSVCVCVCVCLRACVCVSTSHVVNDAHLFEGYFKWALCVSLTLLCVHSPADRLWRRAPVFDQLLCGVWSGASQSAVLQGKHTHRPVLY